MLDEIPQEFRVKGGQARDVVLCWTNDNDRSDAAIAGIKGYANLFRGETERSVNFKSLEITQTWGNRG